MINFPTDDTTTELERLRFALQSAQIGTWTLDVQRQQVWWDARCQELYGFRQDDIVPYNQVLSYMHPDDRQRVDEAVHWALDPQSGGHYEVQFRTLGADDGRLRWLQCRGRADFDAQGVAFRFAGTAQDITQQVVAQQALQQSEARFQNLVREANVGMNVLLGKELRVTVVNEAYGHIIGHRLEEMQNRPLFEVIPDAESYFRPLLEHVMATGEPLAQQEVPYKLRSASGQTLEGFINYLYQPYREADGRITGVTTVISDITQLVNSRQTIAQSEAKLRALIEEAPVATCLFVGRELRIELANQMMLDVWGKDHTVLDKSLVEAVPELKGQPFLTILDEVFTSGQAYRSRDTRAELAINGVLGTYYFDFTYKPLFNAAGQVYAIMDMATDVTEQVLARQQLEEQEAALRSAVELAELGTWTLDIASGDTYLSPRHADMFGLKTSFMSYETALAIVHPHDRGRVRTAFEQALQPSSNGRYQAEYRIINATSGKQQIIRAKGETRRDAQGMPLHIAGTAQDVTLERESQSVLEQLVQQRTQELAATNEVLVATNENFVSANQALVRANSDLTRSNQNLEQFAYIASHDLQEPLRKIQAFGDLLRGQYGEVLGEGATHLTRMQVAAGRMSVLIRDLLAFSRIATTQASTQPVPLNEVIDQALESLSVVTEESGAQVEVDALPTVQGDSSQLSQLFQNLLSNALKFRRTGPEGTLLIPRITVRARRLAREELPASVQPARDAEMYHFIEVIDNGIGFEEKYLDRIFQVFQRLHGRNEFAGTGVGLAIVEKVVTNHGGAVTASGKPNQGATFCVYLPV